MFSIHARLVLSILPLILAIGVARAEIGATSRTNAPAGYTRNVAIVLYEGVELLDFAGPAEVFTAAGSQGSNRGTRAFHVYTVAASKAPLTSQGFLKVAAEYTWDDAPAPDIVVIPGGSSEALTGDPKFMAWIGKTVPKAEISMTVCTGAFALAKVGFLDGVSATTWYGAIDSLRKQAPRTSVIEGRRFIDNGAILTTAGVSAGIDGALHTVARLLGRNVADRTARYMEYHWTPESYLAQRYSYLNPSLDERGTYAIQGKKAEAIRTLEEAVAAGFKAKWQLVGDPDLASLREEAQFQKLVSSL